MTLHDPASRASTEKPMWRERELLSRPAPEVAAQTTSRGQYASPFEKGSTLGVEPPWKLSGVIDETRLRQQQEERMILDEEEKFEMVSALYQEELIAQANDRQELLFVLGEEEVAAAQEEAEDVARQDEENEAMQDEIESLVRELRMQALEHGLRQVESHVHKAHQTTLKAVVELDHEAEAMQEMYMKSVLEQQERTLEDQETEKFEAHLFDYQLTLKLASDSKEAVASEADQNQQRQRRIAAVELAHANSQMEEESVLERMSREQEETDRQLHNADLVRSLTDGKEAMRMILTQATEKDKVMKAELKERHDLFVSQVNEQVVLMHVEAEKVRRREWANRDLSFNRSEELLHKARNMVKNMDTHMERLDSEYQTIVERHDVWPPGPSYSQPYQPVRNRSAGAKFDHDVPASERPATAPLRQRSASRREMLVKMGRAKAPTGFSYAIRIVFEHMDRAGTGDMDETEMLEGLRLLGLDTSDVSLASVFNEGGNDASSRIDFQDFEDMVMSVLATKGPGTAKKETKDMPKIGTTQSELGTTQSDASTKESNASKTSHGSSNTSKTSHGSSNISNASNVAAKAAAVSILEERSFEL